MHTLMCIAQFYSVKGRRVAIAFLAQIVIAPLASLCTATQWRGLMCGLPFAEIQGDMKKLSTVIIYYMTFISLMPVPYYIIQYITFKNKY